MSARSQPTPEQYEAFLQSADDHEVPVTLLFALARVETGFDESYAAAAPSTCRGMFRFTDEMRAEFKSAATGGMNEQEQQIALAAAMLAQLLSGDVWRGNQAGAVMSFYFAKAPLEGFATPSKAGAFRAAQLPHPTTDLDQNKALWSESERQYLDAVSTARVQFQAGGKLAGKGRLQQLALAYEALRQLNRSWAQKPYGYLKFKITLENDTAIAHEYALQQLENGQEPPLEVMQSLLDRYVLWFDAAPLTNTTTPAPEALIDVANRPKQYTWFGTVGRDVAAEASDVSAWAKRGFQAAEQLAGDIGEAIEQTIVWVGVGVLGLGVLYVIAAGVSRGRRES